MNHQKLFIKARLWFLFQVEPNRGISPSVIVDTPLAGVNLEILPEIQRTRGIESILNINRFSDRNQFVTCIGSRFGHQVALLALLVNVTNSLCFLQVAPFFNGYKYSHQM